MFAPYFLLSAATFTLYRTFSRGSAYVQVAPNLFLGRRLTDREAEAGGWASVLDLAAEFPALPWEQTCSAYRSLPVLDAAAPSEEELRQAALWIAEAVKAGPVYVHCALGHGRSACVIVAYLLSIGEIGTVDEGAQRLQSMRPGVQLSPAQLQVLRRFEAQSACRGARLGAADLPDEP
jgi:hypothetical protein